MILTWLIPTGVIWCVDDSDCRGRGVVPVLEWGAHGRGRRMLTPTVVIWCVDGPNRREFLALPHFEWGPNERGRLMLTPTV